MGSGDEVVRRACETVSLSVDFDAGQLLYRLAFATGTRSSVRANDAVACRR